jgi:hypothetical protein
VVEIDRHGVELERQGFTVLEPFAGADFLGALQERVSVLFGEEEQNPSPEFRWECGARRLNNLADKGEVFEQAIVASGICQLVQTVLGPEIKLSSITARSSDPHSDSPQPLHVDLDLLPDSRGYCICNALWMLDDFTLDNGPLRAVPDSHRWHQRPQDVMPDVYAPHPGEVVITGRAGSVVVVNAHTWHGALANRTSRERRALSVLYCRRDILQQQYQKKLLRKETQEAARGDLRRLLALDDPLNDELSMKFVRMRLETTKLLRGLRQAQETAPSDSG